MTERQNRLAASTSPYLLQHAGNPVDWYPWGEEALSRARSEGKPILLSIGYSACHWCHVMAHESFEDASIAALMNEHFVNVKVDREERPDLDDVYMAATLALNQGQGGWPMTVFLTPDQQPFFAGTYFPPEDRWGRPGFRSLLLRISEAWRGDRANLLSQAGRLVDHLRKSSSAAPGQLAGEEELRAALAQLGADFDSRHGGFGRAPKFPPSAAISLLLRCHHRFGDPQALTMATRTLDAMAAGGIYDQVGGGFARYSTDEQWLVPHFEKMLYDNAQLARVYLEAYQVAGEPHHRRVAEETLDYLLREMQGPEGGFFSATDADSEGEEGRFFVWTPAGIEAAVGDPELARRFCEAYDVSDGGNWEGKSILNVRRPLLSVAKGFGISLDELEASLLAARARVYAARAKRVAPGLDDKVLCAWNGLAIGALAEAHHVLREPRYLDAARKAASFVLGTLRKDGRLLRSYRAGVAHIPAYLEDHAYLADALVDLFEASGEPAWLGHAAELAERMLADFRAEDGSFYSTARDAEALVVRPREGHDGATPAANAVAARALARLSYHLDRPAWRDAALQAIRAWGRAIARQPRAFATSLGVLDFLLDGPVEIALLGEPGSCDFEALREELADHHVPNRVLAFADPAAGPSSHPLLAGKTTVNGQAALYVCRDFACQRPVTDPEQVPIALDAPPPPSAPPLLAQRLAGRATAAGTAAFPRQLGTTGLRVSALGFGGYRVDDENPEHRQALRQALLSGVNLIDTSTNYTDGGSEALVGAVLEELIREQRLSREQLVVVSKAGYVQGQNLQVAQEREAAGEPFPEIVQYDEGVWHCIHPEFLADQLERSLHRLRLQTLDVLLLHNPEYFLKDAHERSHGKLPERLQEFQGRIEHAFRFLEEQVAAGRIGCYGVSSNTCVLPEGDPEATSLLRFLDAARAVGGADHHFRVLQLPLNLLEPAAFLEPNHAGRSVLECARENGVAVLVNRPLNAAAGEGMVRLASVEVPAQEHESALLLDALAELEGEFRTDLAGHLQVAEGALQPAEFFRFGRDLRGVEAQIQDLLHWEAIEAQRILPRLMQPVHALDELLQGPLGETWAGWRGRYLERMRQLLDEYRRTAAVKSHRVMESVTGVLDPLLPAQRRAESLSRKALWLVASTPGVSCTLAGMRKPAYVEDALGMAAWEPLPDVAAIYRAGQGIADRR